MARINESSYDYNNRRRITVAPGSVGEHSTTKERKKLPNGEFSIEYKSGEYYRRQPDGSKDIKTKAGAIFHFDNNSNAQIAEVADLERNRLLYIVEGDDVDIQLADSGINMQKVDSTYTNIRELDHLPLPKSPQKVEFIINGNRVGVRTPFQTNMEIHGDNCKIVTGDNNDDITIDGSSNIVYTNGGDDKVSVENGGGNNVYLGNGNDTFEAPKDSVANFVHHDSDGWDKIKNGTDLNPYFGSFLGNLGPLGTVWGATKFGTAKAFGFYKKASEKAPETLDTTVQVAKAVGKTAYNFSILGAADDYIEFQKNRPAEIEKNFERLEKKLLNNE